MKRTPLRRGRPRRRTAGERAASAAWGTRGRCEIPYDHECDGRVENHHVIDQEKLRDVGREDLLWDPRNRLRVDNRTHRRHTNAVERIRRDALRPEHLEFAAELGLEWWIERFYVST